MAGRLERRILRINDQLAALAVEENLVREELSYHRHINDDAQRDAALGNSDDRAFAYDSAQDVERFERALADVHARRAKAEAKRIALLAKLPSD